MHLRRDVEPEKGPERSLQQYSGQRGGEAARLDGQLLDIYDINKESNRRSRQFRKADFEVNVGVFPTIFPLTDAAGGFGGGGGGGVGAVKVEK